MLTLLGPKGRFCDGISRRSFLKVGGLAMGGLSLPTLLQAESVLRAFGLDPYRTRLDAVALVVYYAAALGLATSVFLLSLMPLGRLRGRINMAKGARLPAGGAAGGPVADGGKAPVEQE